jgi:hypothetical protein
MSSGGGRPLLTFQRENGDAPFSAPTNKCLAEDNKFRAATTW